LSLQSKRWRVAPRVGAEDLARFPDLSPLIVQLLHNRQIHDPGAARDYLQGQTPGYSPFELKGMYPAVERLSEAMRNEESIAVYGDFDTDGVTATVLLVQALLALATNFRPPWRSSTPSSQVAIIRSSSCQAWGWRTN
jgi:single-stranded-DNA-specific exonuclease